MQIVKRVLGGLLLLYGVLMVGWVGYNLLVEWTGKLDGPRMGGAVGMALGALFVGGQWVRGRRAFGGPDEPARGDNGPAPGGAEATPPAALPEHSAENRRPWVKETVPAEPAAEAGGNSTGGLWVAQGILLFVGIVSLGLNLYLLLNVDREIAEARAAGARVGEDTVRVIRGVYIGSTALGAVFVALGLVVWKAPLPVTIAGFLLYVVGNFVVLVYTNFAGGNANYVKLFFALALARSISDAAAYERERRAERRKRLAALRSASSAGTGDEREQKAEE